MATSRCSGAALGLLVSVCFAIPDAHAADVAFNQLDWVADAGGYTAFNSEWGLASIHWDASDIAKFSYDGQRYTGYINLVTRLPGGADNWAVHNMPVSFANPSELTERSADGFHFDLGIERGERAVEGIDYFLSVDPAPLAAAAPGAMVGAAVTKEERLVGGLIIPEEGISGGTGQLEPPPAQNFGASSLAFRGNGIPGVQGVKIKGPDADIAAVNEPKNYCAPGGVTRGFRYLDDQSNAFTLSQTTSQMLSTLATKMETSGSGTYVDKISSGKQAYIDMYSLPIVTQEVVNVCLAYDTIQNCGAVEINLQWGKKVTTNESMGGHTAFVAEIRKNIDAGGNVIEYWVRVIDDPKQGDGMAANRSYWLDFNGSNDLLGWWPGAHLISFVTQSATVPEPGAAMLAALGAVAFGIRRRRTA